MSKWCLNHKKDLPDFQFHASAPDRALCKECIDKRIRTRNKDVFLQADRNRREQEALGKLVASIQAGNDPYVYLIEHENRYKIGYSKNINKRIKSFNTSHAIPCKIVAVAPGDKELESTLHTQFIVHRIKGEWFLKKPSILKAFKQLTKVLVFLPGFLKQESSTSSDDSDSSCPKPE